MAVLKTKTHLSPSCAEAGIQPTVTFIALINYLCLQVTELEVRGAIPAAWRDGLPRQADTCRKTPRLIIITFYELSTLPVSHSDTAQSCQRAM